MKPYIKERTFACAKHVVETNDTIRATAKKFGLSKSTVHNDFARHLESVDENLYENVRKILEKNFAEKHIRGGISTKNKYQKK